MLEILTGFVEELRAAGLPVSLTETLDAASAIEQVAIGDRAVLRSALAATLVKSSAHLEAFATVFDVYFSATRRAAATVPEHGAADDGSDGPGPWSVTEEGSSKWRGSPVTADDLEIDEALDAALRSGDPAALTRAARLAVALYAGFERGRPVGIAYYLYKTLHGLDIENRLARLMEAVGDAAVDDERRLGMPAGPLGDRLVADELASRADALRRLVEAEIRGLLVDERGSVAVARTQRRTLVEDVDFMHATRDELIRMRRTLYPLSRLLAARLAKRRRRGRAGSLDFRATIRRSLSTGGVPLEPRFRSARPAKPEIVVIADVSGSVATFARFTLHLVHAISSQFSAVRTFVFVDGIDEVSRIFARSPTIDAAIARVAAEADVVHLDGHSDYGHAFGVFAQRWAREVTSRTSVVVLGDARSNYHDPGAEQLAAVARRARHVYWLNPEPRPYWGTGDSVVDAYRPVVDEMVECRNLRQLERFVECLDT